MKNILFRFVCILIILPIMLSEQISPGTLNMGFKGTYFKYGNFSQNLMFDYLTQKGQCKLGLVYKNSKGKISFDTDHIVVLEYELFDCEYQSQKSIIVKIYNIQQILNSHLDIYQDKNFPMTISHMLNGQQIKQCTIEASGNKLVMSSPNEKSGLCFYNIKSNILDPFIKKSLYLWYSISYSIVLVIQTIVCYYLFQKLKNMVINNRSISCLSTAMVYIYSINRMIKLLRFVWSGDLYMYFIPLSLLSFAETVFATSVFTMLFRFRPILRQHPKKLLFGLMFFAMGYSLLTSFFQFQIWANMVVPILLFIPQIVKNYKNRILLPISIWYIIYLILPIAQPIYFYAIPQNIYYVDQNILYLCLWCGSFVFFIGILLLQQRFGGTLYFQKDGLKKLIFSFQYLYQTVDGQQVPTCSICLQKVNVDMDSTIQNNRANNNVIPQSDDPLDNVDTLKTNQSLQNTLLQKQKNKIFKTPCAHLFHKVCLRQWMKTKFQCPCCRYELPMIRL